VGAAATSKISLTYYVDFLILEPSTTESEGGILFDEDELWDRVGHASYSSYTRRQILVATGSEGAMLIGKCSANIQ